MMIIAGRTITVAATEVIGTIPEIGTVTDVITESGAEAEEEDILQGTEEVGDVLRLDEFGV